VVVPDIATEWYMKELKKRAGEKTKEVSYYSPIGKSCYPLGDRKEMKAPIRLVPKKTLHENSFKRISPEFLAILKRHEDWLLNKYPEYGKPKAYIKTTKPMTIYDGYRMPPMSRPPLDPECKCGYVERDFYAIKKGNTSCYPFTKTRS